MGRGDIRFEAWLVVAGEKVKKVWDGGSLFSLRSKVVQYVLGYRTIGYGSTPLYNEGVGEKLGPNYPNSSLMLVELWGEGGIGPPRDIELVSQENLNTQSVLEAMGRHPCQDIELEHGVVTHYTAHRHDDIAQARFEGAEVRQVLRTHSMTVGQNGFVQTYYMRVINEVRKRMDEICNERLGQLVEAPDSPIGTATPRKRR